ncbi:MAG: hypothetical protein WBG30_11155 [Psychrilyobacter sp.]|uniref:hypothetical protein n=1 Tax=Psychrilyobacter sp. TaxID=2586924 RepID=UPI003C73274B
MKIKIGVITMEYTAKLKVDLTEVKVIRTLLEVEMDKNKLKIDTLNILEYNDLLKKLLKKIQLIEINILEDSLGE